ncbi:MAG: acyl carrier protein [Bryobacterales bacterium]|nr:acyl carrier protein [Bryobacterales bacterium]
MTLEQVYAAVSPVAEQVLQIPRFDHTQTMMSAPTWDSLRHIQLLSAVEREFGIEIGADDAFRLVTADKLVQYVHARLQQEIEA